MQQYNLIEGGASSDDDDDDGLQVRRHGKRKKSLINYSCLFRLFGDDPLALGQPNTNQRDFFFGIGL